MLSQSYPAASKAASMERAAARAREEGTRAVYDAGVWYASSTSRPGHFYRVDVAAGTCECQASGRGLYCKHLAAVAEVVNSTCPVCGAKGDCVKRPYYIGGKGYVEVLECRDKNACLTRQERRSRAFMLTSKGHDTALLLRVAAR